MGCIRKIMPNTPIVKCCSFTFGSFFIFEIKFYLSYNIIIKPCIGDWLMGVIPAQNPKIRHKLKELISTWPANGVFCSNWLKQHGYSYALLHEYVKAKWLKQITRGVYARYQDSPVWEGIINGLQEQTPSLIHVGGKSALELNGFIQYVPLNFKTIHLYTPINASFPKWLLSQKIKDVRFVHYSSDLFSKNQKLGITEIEVSGFKLKISTPERAILEMIHNVSKNQSFIEVAEVFEFLNSLRAELLNQLLENCKSIKVKRIFLFLSEFNKHPWWDKINKNINIGHGKRLVEKNGALNKKYLITVPLELVKKDYDNEE